MNGNAEELVGFVRSELVGKSIFVLKSDEERRSFALDRA